VDYDRALADGSVYDYWRDFTLDKPVPATPPRPVNPEFGEELLQKVLNTAYRKFYARPALWGRRLRDKRVWNWAAETFLNLQMAKIYLAEFVNPSYAHADMGG
jgi:hypothetical protein